MQVERLIIAILVIVFALERLSNTFALPRKILSDQRQQKFETRFTAAMLMLYSSCVISSVFLYFNSQYKVNPVLCLLGGLILMAGCLIRRFAIKAMGGSWSVYTVAEGVDQFINFGVFKYCRHPYYWASLIELIGLALFVNSGFGVLLALLIYFPLLIYRSLREEKYLIKKFPDYEVYKKQAGFFLRIHL